MTFGTLRCGLVVGKDDPLEPGAALTAFILVDGHVQISFVHNIRGFQMTVPEAEIHPRPPEP
jgi:hypothetical protein